MGKYYELHIDCKISKFKMPDLQKNLLDPLDSRLGGEVKCKASDVCSTLFERIWYSSKNVSHRFLHSVQNGVNFVIEKGAVFLQRSKGFSSKK